MDRTGALRNITTDAQWTIFHSDFKQASVKNVCKQPAVVDIFNNEPQARVEFPTICSLSYRMKFDLIEAPLRNQIEIELLFKNHHRIIKKREWKANFRIRFSLWSSELLHMNWKRVQRRKVSNDIASSINKKTSCPLIFNRFGMLQLSRLLSLAMSLVVRSSRSLKLKFLSHNNVIWKCVP